MTTDEQRAEWRRVTNAATPGPWYVPGYSFDSAQVESRADLYFKIYDEGGHTDEDAQFIAASREAMPALLDDVDAGRAALLDVRAILADVQDGTPWQVAIDSALLRISAALGEVA